jgi:hypothetical protein
MLPAGVSRPMLLPATSVNQRFPSGPSVMASGPLAAVGTGTSVILPEEPREHATTATDEARTNRTGQRGVEHLMRTPGARASIEFEEARDGSAIPLDALG